MKKLNALALSAVLIPALSFGSMAFAADDHDRKQSVTERAQERAEDAAGMQDDEQRSGDLQAGDAQRGEQQEGRQHIGDQHREDQRAGDMDDDDGDWQAGDMDGDDQAAGEQYFSGTPSGGFHADDLIGSDVNHRGTDESIGTVQDLIIGDDGQVVGLIVKTGGFLGLGGRNVGLGWDHIDHTQDEDDTVLYTDMEKDALRDLPEYHKD